MARMGRPKGTSVKSYIKVTNDRYEFPLSVPMTLQEMAAFTGMNPRSITWECTPSGMRYMANAKSHRKPWKIISFMEEDAE